MEGEEEKPGVEAEAPEVEVVDIELVVGEPGITENLNQDKNITISIVVLNINKAQFLTMITTDNLLETTLAVMIIRLVLATNLTIMITRHTKIIKVTQNSIIHTVVDSIDTIIMTIKILVSSNVDKTIPDRPKSHLSLIPR